MFIFASKLVLIFAFIFMYTTTSAQNDWFKSKCVKGSYTLNSSYQINLETSLSKLNTTNSGSGFFNLSISQGINAVTSVALCRGDINLDVCLNCLGVSIVKLQQACPNQREAAGYLDYCFLLHYPFNTTHEKMKISDYVSKRNIEYARNLKTFYKDLRQLIEGLTANASAGSPLLKFASGSLPSTHFTRIYALVQCTPDLSKQKCTSCLYVLMKLIPKLGNRRDGLKLYAPKCNFRYDTKPFFNESEPLIPMPPTTNIQPSPGISPPPGKKINTRFVVIGTVSVTVVVVIVIATLCIFLRLKKKKKETPPPRPLEPIETEIMDEMESLHYSFDTVKAATDDFSEERMVGRGGFGEVYKGVLEDGREIAAKKHAENSEQGDVEFKNEVLLASKLQHHNLVNLLGFSINGSERLLIYEFLPNASLDQFLFDPVKRKLLGWEKRLNIIKGIAAGLLYLHEGSRIKIIHLDMKASNVLLDEHMDPKIADFGLAKQIKRNQNQGETSQVAGTLGYMAPEYLNNGEYSEKSDVYSFGVLILEIITGENTRSLRNEEKIENISSYVWKSWNKGTARDIIDPTLEKEKESVDLLYQILRCINIGLLCVQQNADDRPTMCAVMLKLHSSETLSNPSEPAFLPLGDKCSSSTGDNALDKNRTKSSQISANYLSLTQTGPR